MTPEQIKKLTGKEATKLMTIKRSSDNLTLNLYDDFGGGILYNKIEGMDSVGESKNTYTEEYADAANLRVYMPSGEVYNKATIIKLTLEFVGANRSAIKDTFIQFIKKGKFEFNDGVRGRSFQFVYVKNSEPKEDVYKGSIHYIEITFELQNISGKTTQNGNSTENTITYMQSGTPNNNTWGVLWYNTDSNKLFIRAYKFSYTTVNGVRYIGSQTLSWIEMKDGIDFTSRTQAGTAPNYGNNNTSHLASFYDPYVVLYKYTSVSTTTKYRYAGGKLISVV